VCSVIPLKNSVLRNFVQRQRHRMATFIFHRQLPANARSFMSEISAQLQELWPELQFIQPTLHSSFFTGEGRHAIYRQFSNVHP
jgi:hypothetical protein